MNLHELDAWVEEEQPDVDAVSAEEALRFERWHECLGCGKRINTRWKFCQHCVREKAWVRAAEERWDDLAGPDANERSKRRYGDDNWWRDTSFDCGCTSSSNPDISAKDWFPPDPDCAACQGTGRVRDKHHYLRKGRKPKAAPDIDYVDAIEAAGEFGISETEAATYASPVWRERYDPETGEAVAIEAAGLEVPELSAGGWHIETGAPEVPHRQGEPAPLGPAPKGERRPARIEETLRDLLCDEEVFDAYFDASGAAYNGKRPKRAASHFRDVWTAKSVEDGVNIDALSRVSGVPKRTIRNRLNRGKLALVAPKGDGENTMTNTGVLEHVDARFDQLEERLEEEMNDIFRVLWAFRHGETSAEDWQAYLAEREKPSTP
jgi:hypothetical protein